MDDRRKEEFGLLYARLDDLAARSARGEVAISPFFSPREQYFAEHHLARRGVSLVSFGGVRGAERKRIYLLPDYMEADGDDLPEVLASYGFSSEISALLVKGSGYRTLTHRDFLGSLLGLGLERTVIGDILPYGENGSSAVVLCESGILPFLEAHLERVGNDKVRLSVVGEETLSALSAVPRTSPISDTVASARLDCVVASLCRLSREKARECVLAELVELNFECEDRPDRTVEAPAILSVRGVGRFRVLSLSDLTKKGRLRLLAEKYE
ncbi:MAG: hypothetical protein J6Q82_00015 [Clostridia bacterium]|nr:hypothetical protein [Clostridia bacterium]